MNSGTIIELIKQRHGLDWVFVEELRGGSGYGGDNERRMDAWAMHQGGSQ